MKLLDFFIKDNTRAWLLIILLGVGGVISFLNIGKLEDPAFTIKTAVIVTRMWITSLRFLGWAYRKSRYPSWIATVQMSCRKSGIPCVGGWLTPRWRSRPVSVRRL